MESLQLVQGFMNGIEYSKKFKPFLASTLFLYKSLGGVESLKWIEIGDKGGGSPFPLKNFQL